MNITELLVTGYNGNEPVFVVTLAPNHATTVLTRADGDGDTSVESVGQQTTGVFGAVRELLEGLVLAVSR